MKKNSSNRDELVRKAIEALSAIRELEKSEQEGAFKEALSEVFYDGLFVTAELSSDDPFASIDCEIGGVYMSEETAEKAAGDKYVVRYASLYS